VNLVVCTTNMNDTSHYAACSGKMCCDKWLDLDWTFAFRKCKAC